mgnify:CR=1 FL=1
MIIIDSFQIFTLACLCLLCYGAIIGNLYLYFLPSLALLLAASAAYLRMFIYAIRNLYGQRHDAERREFYFRACLSECALFFGFILMCAAIWSYFSAEIFHHQPALSIPMLFQRSFWLIVIGPLLKVLNSLTDHKWYHRVAVALGVIILTVVYISTYYLIYIYSAYVLFHCTIWLVITYITVSIYGILGASHHRLYTDLLLLIFYLSVACMISIMCKYLKNLVRL